MRQERKVLCQLSFLLIPAGICACLAIYAKRQQESPQILQAGTTVSLKTGQYGWITTRRPAVAISSSETIYVLWPAKGKDQSPSPVGIPRIPSNIIWESNAGEFSGVPGVTTWNNRNWSKPGLLIDGSKRCDLLWAWCDGVVLNLLVVNEAANQCKHLQYSEKSSQWSNVSNLPFAPNQNTSFRRLGKKVYLACRENEWIYLFQFDGDKWLQPTRTELSSKSTSRIAHVRLAVSPDGVAHVGWWIAEDNQGEHHHCLIKDETVSVKSLDFQGEAINGDKFELATDRLGKVFVAYAARNVENRKKVAPLLIRRWEGEEWSKPATLNHSEDVVGGIVAESDEQGTLVTWLSRKQEEKALGTARVLRCFCVTDGKSWSQSQSVEWLGDRGAESGLPRILIDDLGRVHMVWGSPEVHHCILFEFSKTMNQLMQER